MTSILIPWNSPRDEAMEESTIFAKSRMYQTTSNFRIKKTDLNWSINWLKPMNVIVKTKWTVNWWIKLTHKMKNHAQKITANRIKKIVNQMIASYIDLYSLLRSHTTSSTHWSLDQVFSFLTSTFSYSPWYCYLTPSPRSLLTLTSFILRSYPLTAWPLMGLSPC